MRRATAFLMLTAVLPTALGWNAHGHRTITFLALASLPADAPDWLRAPESADVAAYQSNLPDRWRGWHPTAVLAHENAPDHYLDAEQLAEFGLTLETLPPLRNEYLRAMAVSKQLHPELVTTPYDAGRDSDKTREWPGFLPYAIVEHYTKLQSAFNEIRVLEKLNDPQRAYQLSAMRQAALLEIGLLSHFVGDAAQPLHTTKNYNGWVGDNPHGFTTSHNFHSFIDGRVLEIHDLSFETLKANARTAAQVTARDPWPQVLKLIQKGEQRVEPLYELEKSKELEGRRGKEFISDCLLDGADFLRALVAAAWESAAPSEKQMADFANYDGLHDQTLKDRGRSLPGNKPTATAPAALHPTD